MEVFSGKILENLDPEANHMGTVVIDPLNPQRLLARNADVILWGYSKLSHNVHKANIYWILLDIIRYY